MQSRNESDKFTDSCLARDGGNTDVYECFPSYQNFSYISFFFFHLKGFKSVFHIFLFFFSIKRSPQWPLVVSVTRSLGCDPNVLQDLMGKGREGGKVRYLMVGIFR